MIDWQNDILPRAAAIVLSYETGVTLRQLFYRLVAAELIPNKLSTYKTLSRVTAEARRRGEFPALLDRTRSIHRVQTFEGPSHARRWLADVYRRDRTQGQDVNLYIGVEKHGLVELLRSWFGPMGLPILAFGGYSSQSYVDEVADDIEQDGRPSVILYAGDFDPSGVDIPRDFLDRLEDADVTLERVALNADQVTTFDLPPQMGKASDSRASQFVASHGRLVQVELDALDPDDLRGVFTEAIRPLWDMSQFETVRAQEDAERATLDR